LHESLLIAMNNLTTLWKYREMLWFILQREVKVRYKQAFFGVAWSIITPVTQALIFFFLFGRVFRITSEEIPYLLLVFSGFTFWNFLANSISTATFSLTSNSALVTKVAFPKEILVIGTVLGRIPDLLGSVFVLALLLVIYQIPVSIHLLWILPLFIVEIILALGVGLLFANINVYFRDVNALVPLLLMAWLFLTPVVYPLASLPENIRLYAILNPMTGILEGIRNVLFLQKPPDFLSSTVSEVITLLVFGFSYSLFKKLEKGFADII